MLDNTDLGGASSFQSHMRTEGATNIPNHGDSISLWKMTVPADALEELSTYSELRKWSSILSVTQTIRRMTYRRRRMSGDK